jgi:hypothetical protein
VNLPNGAWTAVAGDNTSGLRLEIRVDLNRPPRINKMSADLYIREAGTERFDATFESTFIEPKAGSMIVIVTLMVIGTRRTATLIFSQPEGAAFPSLIFLQEDQQPIPTQLKYSGSEILRAFRVQIEIQSGVDDSLPRFDQAYPPSEINWKNRRITVDQCFADAGLSLEVVRRKQALPGPAAWDTGSLRVALNTNFDPSLRSDPTAIYLLIAGVYNDANVFGIMFDELHRRGSAVFYRTLNDRYGDQFARNYIRTVVHEVGHSLNLPHAFERGNLAGRDDADGASKPTFMNYPHLYTGGGNGSEAEQENNYWRDFNFSFAPGELMFLGHGPRDQVCPGTGYIREVSGNQGVSDTSLEVPEGISGAVQEIDGIRLSLRLRPERPGNLFRFGEPVHIEAELANKGDRSRRIQRTLQPSASSTCYVIRQPHGNIVTFRPPFTCCRGRDDHELQPGKSFHTDFCLSFSASGFPFMEPGQYLLQGIYQGLGPPLYSNILRLWVRYPTSAEEDLVVPTLDGCVAAYLSVGGHPGLTDAVRRLDTFLAHPFNTRDGELLPTAHPLAFYYYRCRAIRSVTKQHTVERKGRRWSLKTVARKPDNYDLFRDVLGLDGNFDRRPEVTGLPLSNLVVGTLGRILGEALKTEKRAGEMRRVLRSVRTYLHQANGKSAATRAFDNHWKQPPPYPLDRDWV